MNSISLEIFVLNTNSDKTIRKSLLMMLCVFFVHHTFAQKVINSTTTINKPGKVIITYNSVTKANENKILLTQKYLDSSKPIMVNVGSNIFSTDMKALRRGVHPTFNPYERFLGVQFKDRHLVINAIIYNIDETVVAELNENKLIINEGKYYYKASEKSLEVFNEFNIPVLQVELDKQKNSINITGLFFYHLYAEIISNEGSVSVPAPKSYFKMSKEEQNKYLDTVLQVARFNLRSLQFQQSINKF